MDGENIRADKRLHFKNPPIVEAAIGVVIPQLPDSHLIELKELVLSTDDNRYQDLGPVTQSHLEMKIEAGQSTAVTKDRQLGWRWESLDKLHIVQLKLDGFAFSRLGRYETWESFTGEAKRLWSIFYSAIPSTTVSGFGVRYINKVFFPAGEEIGEYLNVYPQTPRNQPWLMNESIMRLGFQVDAPRRGKFIHQHFLIPSDRPESVAVILDNDFQYSTESLSEDELWTNIDAVRDVKDEYFLEVTTPKLREAFDV